METKVVSFEQMPELIQNLVERIEALEKTVREAATSTTRRRVDERGRFVQTTWQIKIRGISDGEVSVYPVYTTRQ